MRIQNRWVQSTTWHTEKDYTKYFAERSAPGDAAVVGQESRNTRFHIPGGIMTSPLVHHRFVEVESRAMATDHTPE